MTHINLANIQSNILRHHFRKNTRFIFIRFETNPATLKAWLSGFPAKFNLSSAQTDLEDYKNFKKGITKKELVSSILLSATAYQKMGFKKGDDGLPEDTSFWKGMKARGKFLNDPAYKQWEPNYQHDSIDALIILADDAKSNIDKKMKAIGESLEMDGIGQILFSEDSMDLSNKNKEKIDHFGYRDGLSQPKLWDKEKLLKDNLEIVLEGNAGGSYMVFRKLEQNVKMFNERIKALAQSLKLEEEYIGARIIGRHKDGRPLNNSWYPSNKNWDVKQPIDYTNDPEGIQCPFHAHTRKMNPQTKDSKYKRIVRRGVTYDNRVKPKNSAPEKDAGLLFVCYQASIKDQFEYLQARWANNPDYPKKQTGIDPLIGQHDNRPPAPSDNGYCTATECFNFSGAVKFKGGAYFFAPGISFLKNIHEYPKSHGKKAKKAYGYERKTDFNLLMYISNSGMGGFGY